MKLNRLAGIGAFMIIVAQICALAFAIIDLTNYYSFNWIELPDQWLLALICILISLTSINIITTLISMFKVNNDIKSLSVGLAIISIAVTWYPYFFPAIIAFTGAILLIAGKYKPIGMAY